MWIFMKSDLYQQKTSALHTLSPALLFSVLCCNPPSCSPSLAFISPSYLHLSLYITPSNSALSASHLYILMSLIKLLL